jgi:hypothetical protein
VATLSHDDLTVERVARDGRPFWLFSDGTLLPVVSGGSDVGPGGGVDVGAAGDSSSAEATGEAPSAEEDMTDEQLEAAFASLEQDPTTTPKSLAEVRKLRQQVAKRNKSAQALSFLDQFHPDDREYVIETMQSLISNPQAATANMAQMLQSIWGDQLPAVLQQLGLTPAQAAAVEAKADDDGDQGDELDLSDPKQLEQYLEQKFAEREQQRESERQYEEAVNGRIAMITGQLAKLGFPDPTSDDAKLVVLAAKDLYHGDLAKALEGLRAKGFKGGTPSSPAPAGAEAPNGQTAPAADVQPEEPSDPSRPPTRDEIMKRAEQRVRDRLNRSQLPAH